MLRGGIIDSTYKTDTNIIMGRQLAIMQLA